MELLLIFVIILINIFINKIIFYFQFKIIKNGFDHFYHFALIKQIKNNNNKFVSIHSSYLYNSNFMYPQLFHWILSFFSHKFIRQNYKRIGQTINYLTIISFVIFAYTIYDFLQLPISCELFVFYSSLAFNLSPFNFLLWNAKNRGLSVRGFGLLLGYLYLFCIFWLNLYDSFWFYIPIFAISFIVLLSSQFAFQFILLATPFLSLFYKDAILILPPFVAAILYLIFFRKNAVLFFKGQYYHKKNLFLYLARKGLLKRRYSIYRDFVWDFWKKRNIKYMIDNPIITIIFGFPFFSVLIFFIAKDYANISGILSNQSFFIILIPIISALIVFILTSFRPTRFLGEPERYVEFALPFFSVLSIVYLQNYEWLIAILICFSFIYIIYQYSIFGFNKDETDFHVNINKIKKQIISNSDSKEYLIFSNNISPLNFFIDNKKFKILFPSITSESTGSVHIKNIYVKGFPYINSDVLFTLITEFKIKWFILDTFDLKEDDFLSLDMKNLIIRKVRKEGHFLLYKIVYP